MNTKEIMKQIKPSKKNFGWWFLAVLIFICIIGLVYEMLVNRFGFDSIKLFDTPNAYYLDPLLFLTNKILEVLALLNPLIKVFTDIINFIIRNFFTLLNSLGIDASFKEFTFEFRPAFVTGHRDLEIIRVLGIGAILTLQISIASIAIGFVIAIIMAVILVRPGKVMGLKYFCQGYVDFFRSTPLLVQLFIIFFGIPPVIQSLGIPSLESFNFSYEGAAVIGLSLNTAAYQAEIIRGGILAIPTGQTEAARALGMTATQTMRHVIIPQALRIIIPPFTNEGINVILNSSLASAISASELTRKARNLSAYYFITFEIYILAALFYFVMTYSLAKLTKKFEKKYRIPGLGIDYD
ncbi:MAG: amino acid ABC transporter permease [Candidatus Hodarchaeales archaeon]